MVTAAKKRKRRQVAALLQRDRLRQRRALDGHHRTGSHPHDRFGHTAHEQPAQSGPPVGSHDDQIAVIFMGHPQDLLNGLPFLKQVFHMHFGVLGLKSAQFSPQEFFVSFRRQHGRFDFAGGYGRRADVQHDQPRPVLFFPMDEQIHTAVIDVSQLFELLSCNILRFKCLVVLRRPNRTGSRGTGFWGRPIFTVRAANGLHPVRVVRPAKGVAHAGKEIKASRCAPRRSLTLWACHPTARLLRDETGSVSSPKSAIIPAA